MDGFISILTVVLVIAYVGTAVWVIWNRRSISGSVGSAVGFIAGGIVIIPIAEIIAYYACWAIVIVLALFIIGAIFG